MNRITNAIIVPTHPKDFHWTYQLLNSASHQEWFILVFSSKKDLEQFAHPYKNVDCIVANDNIHNWPMATYKKFAGLKYAFGEFQYVATIDTECQLLQPVCPNLETIWNNNCLVANYSQDGPRYIGQVLKDCNITDYPYPTNLYWWFNDIQVYPVHLIPKFLEWLPTNIHMDSFDYLLFGMYMIMQHGHQLRILNGVSKDGLIEELPKHPEHLDKLAQVNWSTYLPGVEKYPNIKMLFHLDRFPRHI